MFKFLLLFLFLNCRLCIAQQEIRLYPGAIPNSKKAKNEEQRTANAEVDSLTSNVSIPSLSIYLPEGDNRNGTGVIICPGGGYHVLLTKREGRTVAEAFNKVGVAAFVLKYRLPSNKTMVDQSIGPLQDAQQAIKVVRENAKRWNINPAKIGIMGFSAGGHLAATAGTHFDFPVIHNKSNTSIRPDFMLLINPVISFNNSIGHVGSRNFLLGESPSQKNIDFFSNELHIKPSTPPAFLVHSAADQVVPVSNSEEFYQSLKRNGISAELHIYARGEHGFLTAPPFSEWFARCIYWMRSMDLL